MIDWDAVHDAFDDFMDMTERERSEHYWEFIAEWDDDLTAEDWEAFWDLYNENG